MAEENVVETAPTEEQTVTEAPEGQTAPAEAKNTETPPERREEEENRIPQSRFSKVVRERNELRDRLAEMERRLEAKPQAKPDDDASPGNEDDVRAEARRMIEADARAMLEREFGMPLAEIKSRIAATENYGQDYVERQWASACEPYGVDPKDEDVQAYVGGLVKYQGVELAKALERAAKRFGNGKSPRERTPEASVESDGVAGTMARSGHVFFDKKSAVEAARKGIRADQIDMMDILSKRSQQK